MDNLIIKNAVERDVPLLLDFIKKIAEYEKLSDEVKATEDSLKESLFSAKNTAYALLAFIDDKAVAYAIYFYNFSTFKGKKGLYLEDIFVLPEYRGRGIGKKLFLHLVEIARNENCGRLEWSVLNWNKPAIDFYISLGASPMNEWTVYRLDEEQFDSLV